jgi:hypothetical protein
VLCCAALDATNQPLSDIWNAFVEEASFMSQLSHERVVQMFGACLAPSRLGVVMRLAVHGTVEQVLVVKKRFASASVQDRQMVAQIIVDISAGMAFLHANTAADGKPAPIVHRDCMCCCSLLSALCFLCLI